MGGKGAILIVLGFSLIFMVAGMNFNHMASSTTENMSSYYNEAKAHQIASSGVNMIVNKLFVDATIPDQTFSYNFDNGTITGVLTTTDAYKNIKQLLCTGTINGTSTTIKIIFKPSLFSKYAYFSNMESSSGKIYWTTSDTVWGPFHTNDDLDIQGNPVFKGKVTIGGSETKTSGSKPQYLGGFQKGVQITLPSNGVSTVATQASGGFTFPSGKTLVYLEFRKDSVRYRYATSGTGSTWTYKLASALSPNGIIYAQNAELHISGTVKGQYTVIASGTTSGQGNVYLDNDIVLNTDPSKNSSSKDMLGIVAKQNVIITNNTANQDDINIQAAIYVENGSFKVDAHDSGDPRGSINLYGGITQKTRGAVGTIGTDKWGNKYIATGYNKRYKYDDRLLISYPPYYPGCGTFEVVSWLE